MPLPSPARLAIVPAAAAVLCLFVADPGRSQPKSGPKSDAAGLLKPAPRPRKVELPPSRLPLELVRGERIALVGNSTAERMNLFGHFEALLHTRFPDQELVVRNFARPADEVSIRQRTGDYAKLDDPLYAFDPDTFVCFFGWNESFKGPGGVEKFKADYERFLGEFTRKYPRDDAGSPPRFVLMSPIAFEKPGDKFLPDGAAENANLKLYAAAVADVARKRGLAVIDLFGPTEKAFAEQPGLQYTINGCHANEAGDKLIGGLLDRVLFGEPTAVTDTARFEKLRAAVNDKSWVHQQDYRMVNGWYVYGDRRTYDTETFPREYLKIRKMAAVRDRYVWDIVAGKPVPPVPEDKDTGELVVPPTRFGLNRHSESPEGVRILSPDDFLKTCTVAPGTELKLFADESKFPEIAKPVQVNFDNKGRLWVSTMPSYPQWRPGDPKPSDKLVILEDADGDGKADKSTVFYDKLMCPVGFEFFDGGVLVIDQPRLLFLKDTDGDDKADVVVHLIDGWATDDTHHTANAFEWNHGGRLHMLEGIATSTTLETPWGPHRSQGGGGCYVLDPRSQKIRQFGLPGMANMWGYTFNEWGQGFVGDGTSPNQTWDSPLSSASYPGRKQLNSILPNGVRPNCGNEWLVSRNLPDDLQRQFTYACVIELNGLTRYEIKDDGGGYRGRRIPGGGGNNRFADLIRSTDKHFRPVDPQIGPDGALWFADWANPLIGHMQYSQRDPNRDHSHGRVYRLVGKDRPPVKPVTQYGKSVAEILEQFREYEWRTRYRARRELHDRPGAEVLPVVKEWAAKLDPSDKDYDRLLCEALWVQQGHHAVDSVLLAKALAVNTPDARAAAVHIASDDRDRLPDALEMLKKAAADPHPRVRTEAARGLSFFPRQDAVDALLAAASLELDYWQRYTIEAALTANQGVWRQGYLTGKLAGDNPAAQTMLASILTTSRSGESAAPHLRTLLATGEKSAEEKNKAMAALAGMNGNAGNGRAVFARNCTACHRVGSGEGSDYGPNLDKVASKLTKLKLIESVTDPNADVDPKFLSTQIETTDGKTLVGLVLSEDAKAVVLFDGKEKRTIPVESIDRRTVLKQSSMPDGLAATMAPSELLDLLAYLWSRK